MSQEPAIVAAPLPLTRRSLSSRLLSDVLPPVVSLVLLVAAWWVAVALFQIPSYIIPSPEAVFESMVDNWDVLLENAVATASVALAGLAISVVIGVPIGLIVARWRLARRVAMPPLVAMQSLPKVALAPMLIAWLGFGAAPKIVLTVVITFFPMTLATIVGVESITTPTLHLARSMGCVGRRFVTFVLLPAAAPFVGAAFRTSATLAVVGTLVAEFVGSAEGLGNLLLLASGNRDTTLAFAAIIAVSILGIIFYVGAALLSRLATLRLGPSYMRSVT